jgi:hypothetical protein
VQFSQWRAEDALTEMGIKPGYEGLDDDVKQPPQPTQVRVRSVNIDRKATYCRYISLLMQPFTKRLKLAELRP